MPAKEIDYSKTIIYKIVCNDLAITDLYVGHTTHFTRRKNDHKNTCNNQNKKAYNLKIYKTIRDNQNWDNWSMIQIEAFPCVNGNEARARERYWYEQLNATLNMVYPQRSKQECALAHYEKNKDKINDKQKRWYINNKEHAAAAYNKEYNSANKQALAKASKAYYESNKDIITQKIKQPYNCDCGSICRINEKSRHFKSKKHQNYIKSLTECIKTEEV
jgi:hypothetical protein